MCGWHGMGYIFEPVCRGEVRLIKRMEGHSPKSDIFMAILNRGRLEVFGFDVWLNKHSAATLSENINM